MKQKYFLKTANYDATYSKNEYDLKTRFLKIFKKLFSKTNQPTKWHIPIFQRHKYFPIKAFQQITCLHPVTVPIFCSHILCNKRYYISYATIQAIILYSILFYNSTDLPQKRIVALIEQGMLKFSSSLSDNCRALD